MEPTTFFVSETLSHLQMNYECDSWRYRKESCAAIQVLLIDLLMLDDGLLTDDEEQFLSDVFVEVTNHQIGNTR